MSFSTRVGVAVFALAFGSALMVARADEKASKAADAKSEAVKTEKATKAEAVKAADSAKAEAGKAAGEAKEAKETKKAVKLVQPWNKLTSLSEDQKDKINAIHQKALAEINLIEKREKTDIEALLTDAQKSELKEIAAEKKKADAEKKAVKKAEDKKEPDKAAPKADDKKAKDAA